MKRIRKSFFEELKQGLEQALAHAKGELTLKTVTVSTDAPEIDARTLAAMRTAAGMSQGVFAQVLNVSTKTLQSWEQGVRTPSDASRRLIQVFAARPDVLCELAGLPAVKLPGVSVQSSKKGRRRIVVKQKARS